LRNARPSWPGARRGRGGGWRGRPRAAGCPGLVRLPPRRRGQPDHRAGQPQNRVIRRAGRITLCVQGTALPYQYASAEGPITAIEDTVTVEQRWPLASRYLGPEGADAYIESTPGATERMVRILMRPEHWLTRDYTKLSS
jgi:hypothetical protein